jgi:hypothetical protein
MWRDTRPRIFFHTLAPGIWSLSQVSQRGPHGKSYPYPESSFTPPVSRNRAPIKRDAPFSEPSFHYHSQFPITDPLLRFPKRPLRRHPSTESTTSHPLKIQLALRVPRKVATSIFPNRAPWKIYYFTRATGLFIHVSLPDSPKRNFSTKWGRTLGYRPPSPTQTEGLHTMGCGLVPQADR